MKKRRRSFFVYPVALVLMVLGSLLQWILISGHIPFSHLVVSIHANGSSGIPIAIAVRPDYGKRDQHAVTVVRMRRPDFQTGIIFPQWGSNAYSGSDTNWQIGLHDIQQETGARWIELPINFYQASINSTTIFTSSDTPTPEAVAEGIRKAHAMNLHVFVVPLLSVLGASVEDPLSWSGSIQFPNEQLTADWFTSYWQALEPYVQAAAQAGADQVAIATECEHLQVVNPIFWNNLIEQMHEVYSGKLTYDMNWSSLYQPFPSWMHNPLLSTIGISEYIALTTIQQRLSPDLMSLLWKEKIRTLVDAAAVKLGKPVLISEIGYRDSVDTMYHPWERTALEAAQPADPEEQAGAYDAALANTVVDSNIAGIYFWAWSVPLFAPNWKPAAKILHKWYTSYLA